jgi:hypothetical protein
MAFDYYGNVYRVRFEINSNKEILKNYEQEREHLIKISGPPAYKAITYDQPRVQGSSSRQSDEQILTRIAELTSYIERYRIIIADKEKTLNKLRSLGSKMLQQLKKKNRTDSVLEIFMMSVFEGKNVDEIKQMGYAPSTIYNAHTIFNKHIELRS